MIWKLLVAVVLWFYAMDVAVTYGGIWQIQAYPIAGAEVILTDGTTLQGELTRDWAKDWVLTTSEGARFHFVNYRSMSFPARLQAEGSAPGLVHSWRQLLPVVVLSGMFIAFAIANAIQTKK